MDAIVLAAGASTRMGRPKALLARRGGTFLSCVCEAARGAGAERIVVVVAEPHAALVSAEAHRCGAETLRNLRPEQGQVSSMALGLEEARGPFALVTLVDIPDWAPRTGRLLADAAEREPAAVHVPTHGGVRGHPLCVPASAAALLAAAGPGEGARDVFARLPVREHPVDDPGILFDVDTPEDLARLEAR